MSDSTATFTGNMTRDPELRFTQSGRAVCTIGLAVSHRYQQNNEWVEKASFLNVVAWGQLGENAASSFKKGDRVIVQARIEQRTWETDQNEKRSTVEFVAEEIGASLKFATVEISKTTKASNREYTGNAPAPAQGQAQPADRQPAPVGGGYESGYTHSDEEPF